MTRANMSVQIDYFLKILSYNRAISKINGDCDRAKACSKPQPTFDKQMSFGADLKFKVPGSFWSSITVSRLWIKL